VRALTDAPPQDEQRAPLRKPRNRNVVWIASACFAVLLTSAGLFAAAGTSSIIRGFFGNGGAPLLAEAKLPKALTERIARADKLITEEKTDEAATLLLAAQSEFPANEADINRVLSRTFRTAGTSQLRAKNFDKAATSFEKASKFDPSDALNWIDRGRALREQARTMNGAKSANKKKEALTHAQTSFEKALELSPSDTSAYLGIAQVHDARNNRQQAIEAYQKIIDIAPQSNEARLAATALQQLKRR
jgi:tetratricopeptide (TPR) repeat protein